MKREHDYKQIEKDIKNGDLKNVVLFYGKEQYLVRWSINRIIGKYVNGACKEMDCSILDSEKATMGDIVENCETLSLFSEKRVVVLPDFLPLSGSVTKNFPEEAVKELAEYIKTIPSTCMLILTAESTDKRKKLYKEIASCGKVYEFDSLDEATLRSFIVKRFKASGVKASTSVISEFIQCSGYFHKETEYTLYNLENDIKKIIAHCGSGEAMLSDVLSAVSGDAETNVFAMIDAVSKDRKDEAFRLMHNLLGSGGNVFSLLSLLASQFESILEVKELKDEGKPFAQMQSLLNIHEFRIKKAISFADNYSFQRLKEILKKVYQAEKNIKTGLMDQVLALEILISEI